MQRMGQVLTSAFSTAGIFLGLIFTLGLGPSTSVSADETLTVVSWGGAYTRSQMLAYVFPFEKKTGIDVDVEDYNGGLAQIRAQVESLNVKWDVVDLALADAVRGCREGLLEKIDPGILAPAPDGTPAAEDFLPGTLTDCAIGENLWATVVAYKQGVFNGGAPTTIADFFNVGRFPGRRGLRKTPRVNLEWALLADGVPPDKVYATLSTPEGVDRAFSVLDRIKAHIVWWTGGDEPARLLADGTVSMTSAYNGRIQYAIDNKGDDFAIVWDGQVRAIELWGIVKGSPHMKKALDFIGFATATEPLAEQAKLIAYGPARASAMALLDDRLKAKLPTAAENSRNVLASDPQWWAANHVEIDGRFAEWLARPTGTLGPLGKAM